MMCTTAEKNRGVKGCGTTKEEEDAIIQNAVQAVQVADAANAVTYDQNRDEAPHRAGPVKPVYLGDVTPEQREKHAPKRKGKRLKHGNNLRKRDAYLAKNLHVQGRKDDNKREEKRRKKNNLAPLRATVHARDWRAKEKRYNFDVTRKERNKATKWKNDQREFNKKTIKDEEEMEVYMRTKPKRKYSSDESSYYSSESEDTNNKDENTQNNNNNDDNGTQDQKFRVQVDQIKEKVVEMVESPEQLRARVTKEVQAELKTKLDELMAGTDVEWRQKLYAARNNRLVWDWDKDQQANAQEAYNAEQNQIAANNRLDAQTVSKYTGGIGVFDENGNAASRTAFKDTTQEWQDTVINKKTKRSERSDATTQLIEAEKKAVAAKQEANDIAAAYEDNDYDEDGGW